MSKISSTHNPGQSISRINLAIPIDVRDFRKKKKGPEEEEGTMNQLIKAHAIDFQEESVISITRGDSEIVRYIEIIDAIRNNRVISTFEVIWKFE
jgi:hypothetical protein